MSEKRYDALLERVESSLDYWSEGATVGFIDSLCRLMEQRKMTKAELARALGTSRAYVTKVLGGNVNFTLTTMVKIALAVRGAVHVHVADKDALVRWVEAYGQDRFEIARFDEGARIVAKTVLGKVETRTTEVRIEAPPVSLDTEARIEYPTTVALDG